MKKKKASEKAIPIHKRQTEAVIDNHPLICDDKISTQSNPYNHHPQRSVVKGLMTSNCEFSSFHSPKTLSLTLGGIMKIFPLSYTHTYSNI